jgi:oxidase EvaA
MKKDINDIRDDLISSLRAAGLSIKKAQLKADFIISSMPKAPAVESMGKIEAWFRKIRNSSKQKTKLIAIAQLKDWQVDEKTFNIMHKTGKFYSIEGLDIKGANREISSWQQPVINQPEVGILGFTVKKINGIYHFLIQAKEEPGNICEVQISTTVMATQSNLKRVHKGKKVLFSEYFTDNKKAKVIFKKKQSEEGARFYKKNNLNIIVEVNKNQLKKVPPNFKWVSLYQLKQLLNKPNTVNAPARSVISCLP